MRVGSCIYQRKNLVFYWIETKDYTVHSYTKNIYMYVKVYVSSSIYWRILDHCKFKISVEKKKQL